MGARGSDGARNEGVGPEGWGRWDAELRWNAAVSHCPWLGGSVVSCSIGDRAEGVGGFKAGRGVWGATLEPPGASTFEQEVACVAHSPGSCGWASGRAPGGFQVPGQGVGRFAGLGALPGRQCMKQPHSAADKDCPQNHARTLARQINAPGNVVICTGHGRIRARTVQLPKHLGRFIAIGGE